MAKVVFKQGSGHLPELFPENIFDKIPDNHPARLVNEVVDSKIAKALGENIHFMFLSGNATPDFRTIFGARF